MFESATKFTEFKMHFKSLCGIGKKTNRTKAPDVDLRKSAAALVTVYIGIGNWVLVNIKFVYLSSYWKQSIVTTYGAAQSFTNQQYELLLLDSARNGVTLC